jgi:hypothetical protein
VSLLFLFSFPNFCILAKKNHTVAKMVEAGPWTLWFNAAILVVVAGVAAVSVYTAVDSWKELSKGPIEKNELYSDEDGTATEETQKKFSVKWQNWILSIVTVAGFAVALVEGVAATIHGWKDMTSIWIEFGTWVCGRNTVVILRDKCSQSKYRFFSLLKPLS